MEREPSFFQENSDIFKINKPLEKKINKKNEQIIDSQNNLDEQYLYLLIIEDNKERNIIYLENYSYEIGRRHNADIILRDLSVSRNHATIIKEYNPLEDFFFYKIIDGNLSGEKSKNGLIINNKKIEEKYLEHGDLIIFGDYAKARFFVIDKNSQGQNFFDLINTKKPTNFDEDSYGKKTLNHIDYDLKKIDIEKEEFAQYINKLGSFAELSPYPIIEVNLQGKITYYNPAAGYLFPNLKYETMTHPILDNLLKAEHNIHGNLFVREIHYHDKIFEQYIHYLPELKVIRIYLFDFTKRKEIEAKLKDSEAKYRAVVEQTSEGILLFTADDHSIIEANQSAKKILGYSLQELIGEKIEKFLDLNSLEFSYRMKIIKQTKVNFQQEIVFLVKGGKMIHAEMSVSLINYQNKLVFCSVFRDISQRKLLEEQLKFQAYHDTLTGLYKRNYFREYARKKLLNSQRKNQNLALIFCDVDHFKEINDNYGHDIGDLLLKKFAERIKYCLKKRDCLARWGGDEFVALLVNVELREDLTGIVERMLESIRHPFIFDGVTLNTSTSIGVAIFPYHGNSLDALLKKADDALYETKRNGRNGYSIAQ